MDRCGLKVEVVKTLVEVMPMVLDFMTVTAFFVLCAYKLLVKLLSMSSCVVNLHFFHYFTRGNWSQRVV